MPTRINWAEAIRPLLEKYKNKKHPLDYENVYQLLVMVVLSAQSTDEAVNKLAPQLFATFPDLESLAQASPEGLWPYFKGIRNFAHKAKWLTDIARQLGSNDKIPLSMEELVKLPGIGRKSASVILRGAGKPPEGIIVDIHVIRVAPRLGITNEEDPKKIEEQMMKALPRDEWDAGMAMSFLGREICRPKPLCEDCLMNGVCAFFARVGLAGVIAMRGKEGGAGGARPAKKTPAKKSPAAKAPDGKAAGGKEPGGKAAARNAPVKKAPPKKAPKKKSPAPKPKKAVKKAPAKKTARKTTVSRHNYSYPR
ncbi:endonuclease III domain-containing protein [Puia sp. P3]|uniref:endonuclease III domain-containing protein n=1 Tax=Puia sp. P3 TaxID=3423952 RepID=UPI003D674145